MKKKKILLNSSLLMTERIAGMGANLAVSILLARYLGAVMFGQLNYVIAFITLFSPLFTLGMNAILTREIKSTPHREGVILGTSAWFRFLGSVLAFVVLLVLYLWRGREMIWLWILGMSLARLFSAFGVSEFWLQAQQRFALMAGARLVVLLVAAGVKVLGVWMQWPLQWIVAVFAVEMALQPLSLQIAYLLVRRKNNPWSIDTGWGFSILRGSFWLILSGFASVIYLKIDQVMLRVFHGDASVGIYAVAARFSEVWYFIPAAVATAVFPGLLDLRKRNEKEYQYRLQQGFDILFWMAAVIALAISLFAGFLVQFLYGEAYSAAAGILQLHVWAGVFVFMRALVSKWLLAEDLLKYSLLSHGGGALINVGLNLLLIPTQGGWGAAMATLVSYASASWLVLLVFPATRSVGVKMTLAPLGLIRIARFIIEKTRHSKS